MIYTTQKYSAETLYAFVNRADTHERVAQAMRFLRRIERTIDPDLFKSLMKSLALIDREIGMDEDEYSASTPWNAPGMRPQDFVR